MWTKIKYKLPGQIIIELLNILWLVSDDADPMSVFTKTLTKYFPGSNPSSISGRQYLDEIKYFNTIWFIHKAQTKKNFLISLYNNENRIFSFLQVSIKFIDYLFLAIFSESFPFFL